jgi:hypothetical protein
VTILRGLYEIFRRIIGPDKGKIGYPVSVYQMLQHLIGSNPPAFVQRVQQFSFKPEYSH